MLRCAWPHADSHDLPPPASLVTCAFACILYYLHEHHWREAAGWVRFASTALRAAAGRVGFGRDMGATRALTGDDSGRAMEATANALLEAEKLMTGPLRRYRFWDKVRLHEAIPWCLARPAASCRRRIVL